MFRILTILVAAGAFSPALPQKLLMAELKPETSREFDKYVQKREAEMDRQMRRPDFLWLDSHPDQARKAREGRVAVAAIGEENPLDIDGGLIHDWVGAAFIPGATIEEVLRFVQNYDNHEKIYQPEVADSKLISKSGDDYKVFLRLRKKKVITVVYNTEHSVRYHRLDPKRWHSRSYSTKIAELESPGEADEREMTPGIDHGFLWKLNSYWRFAERDGGVYIECEAISLTRGIPRGFGWMVNPIIRELPEESLRMTLENTREGLAKKP